MPNEKTELVVRLLSQEVPELAVGIIEIKGIALLPGIRTKLALFSNDPTVDCVGARGSRIKRVVKQLGGELIDLVSWSDLPKVMIQNSIQPADIENVILFPKEHRATVVVKEEQFSLALGRRNMNRDLASRLSGWEIEIVRQ